ncbi:MAG: hypothetical protein ABSC55_28980 [Syntrophorhabdales bacterium]|jgi:hypothetical protein
MHKNNSNGSLGDYENEEFLTPLLGCDDGVKTSGVIRPGIMVLKKGHTDADLATYNRLVAQGRSWEEMAKELPDRLVPQNVDYFTANSHDCLNPTNAELIRKLYADSDGRIRSIPIYFSLNEWWSVIPHRLCCFGSTRGLKHRSAFEYERDASGRVADYRMVCESPENLLAGKKLFGGRGWTKKSCDPEACPEYQKEECRFSGKIYFMIPGVKGMGSWVVPTKSWYSMKRLKATLRDTARITNGRIAYLLHKGEPVFVLRKVKATIPTIDWGKGESKMRQQYLIDLDVVVDPLEVAREYSVEKMLEKGGKAITLLTPATQNGKELEEITVEQDRVTGEKKAEAAGVDHTNVEKKAVSEVAPDKGELSTGSVTQPLKNGNGTKPVEQDQKQAITKMAAKYRISTETLDVVLAALRSYDDAAKVIRELNKGDISRFLPSAGA